MAPAIAPSLTSLFNASLLTDQFPSECKEVNITPAPKAGDKHDINNYRPVSVIPVIAKFFASLIIHDQLYTYVETNKLLDLAPVADLGGVRAASNVYSLRT